MRYRNKIIFERENKLQDLENQNHESQDLESKDHKIIDHHGRDGFVYAMRSIDMMEGRYKIGMTKRHPDKRAKELSTSYENDLEVFLMVKVSDRREAEKKIFELLDDYMPSDNKEIVDVQCLSILENIFEYVRQRYPIDGEGIKVRVTRTIQL